MRVVAVGMRLQIALRIERGGLAAPQVVGTLVAYESEQEGDTVLEPNFIKSFPQYLKGIFHDVMTRLLFAYHLKGEVVGVLIPLLEKNFKFLFLVQDSLFLSLFTKLRRKRENGAQVRRLLSRNVDL